MGMSTLPENNPFMGGLGSFFNPSTLLTGPQTSHKVTPKKKRASAPKVSTGCMACKTRRVKCDEGKPHCNKCESSDRKCCYKPSAHPRKKNPAALVAYALDSLPKNEEERQCFKLFTGRTVQQLAGLFGSAFWERQVLQAALNEPAIWHAVIALGAVHQTSKVDCNSASEVIKVPGTFAVRQYLKAIKCFTKPDVDVKQLNPNVALICCVLFVCFECLHGRYHTAMIHLESGLKLSQERNIQETSLTCHYAPTQSLENILVRLDSQATMVLPFRKACLLPPNLDEITIPKTFHSLEEAYLSSDDLWDYFIRTLHSSDVGVDHRATETSPLQRCASKLNEWNATFKLFFEPYSETRKYNSKEKIAISIIKISKIIGTIALETMASVDAASEKHWDDHYANFSAIITLANNIIDSSTSVEGEGGALDSFSLDTRVVGPLYFVACRCRHRILRRKAIFLLRSAKRLEGLWSSEMLAEIAEKVLVLEEGRKGDDWEFPRVDEEIPEEKRVVNVNIMFQSEDRKVELEYLWNRGQDGVEIRAQRESLVW